MKRLLRILLHVAVVSTIVGMGYGAEKYADKLSTLHSPQVDLYNQATVLYSKGDVDASLDLFDKSLAEFDRMSADKGLIDKQTQTPPSLAVAGLAKAHRGSLLVMKQKPAEAIAAYKDSVLTLTNPDSLKELTQAEINQRQEYAYPPLYDVELIWLKNPSLALKEGKGIDYAKVYAAAEAEKSKESASEADAP